MGIAALHPSYGLTPVSQLHVTLHGSNARWRDAKRRHCERSEAIHSFIMPQRGLLRSARNDVDGPQRTGHPAWAGYSVACGAAA